MVDDGRVEDAIEHILSWEGGHVDHPEDEGGPTKFGITIPTLSRWLERDATPKDIKDLARPMAVAIYHKFYILDMPYKDVQDHWTFRYIVDMGALHTPISLAEIVQRACRPHTEIDGVFGPATLATVNMLSTQDKTREQWRLKLRRERCAHYARRVVKKPGQTAFLAGWLARALAI